MTAGRSGNDSPGMVSSVQTVPVPDPTKLTTDAVTAAMEQVRRDMDGMKELFETRLDGMDKAIDLVHEYAAKIPDVMDEKIRAWVNVHDEKFNSVQDKFKERDTRSERESRDNKVAVDAAFAAQKEAAAKQDEANAKAIDKSERATTETIKTNQELSRATTDALTKSLDEAKQRLTRIEGKDEGTSKTSETHQISASFVLAVVVGVLGVLFGAATLAIMLLKK